MKNYQGRILSRLPNLVRPVRQNKISIILHFNQNPNTIICFIIHSKGLKDICIIHQNNYDFFLLYLRELFDCVLFFQMITFFDKSPT